MVKEELERAALHFPVGCFGAYLCFVHPMMGLVFNIGFLVYEAMNDWRKKDWSYKDIFGYLCGFGVAAGIICILEAIKWL